MKHWLGSPPLRLYLPKPNTDLEAVKKALKWGAIALAVLFVIGLLVPAEETTETEAAVVSSPEATEAVAEPVEAAEPEWTELASLSGNTSKVGDTFTLTGAPARLRWTLDGDEFSTLAVYVVEEGDVLEEVGGFPEVMPDAPGSDVTRLRKSAGEYYLNVSGAGDWSVVIEEER